MKWKLHDTLSRPGLKAFVTENFSDRFELSESADHRAEQLMISGNHIIEIAPESYADYKQHLTAIDWKISQIGVADCLVLCEQRYLPVNALAEAVSRIIRKKPEHFNSLRPVILVGDSLFISAVVMKLVLAGFTEIIVCPVDLAAADYEGFSQKIRSYAFGLQLKVVEVNDLTSLKEAGALLIAHLEQQAYPDDYELVAYFNFLSPGAVFIDCNSLQNAILAEEARKAEIFVVDEREVLLNKYEYLSDILKNSPKV